MEVIVYVRRTNGIGTTEARVEKSLSLREVEFNIWVGGVRESSFNGRKTVRILSRCGFEKLKRSLLAI